MTRDDEVYLISLLIKAIAAALMVFLLSVSSCVMYSNSVEGDNLPEQTRLEKVQNEVKLQHDRSIMQLIDKGVNPIEARCSIMGWKKERETIICGLFVSPKRR